jgi:MFS family permease
MCRQPARRLITGTCAASAAFMTAALLPKALTNQGYAVSVSLGITSIIYATSFVGKGFTGWLMEIIGRRWTIFYVMAGSLPGFCLMLLSHTAGEYARVLMIAGGLIIGFTVVSAFSATRVYLSEQFPTALRGRGHIFGESCGRIFAGGLVPFFMAPHTGSPIIFFGTMLLFSAIGAAVPILFSKETVGRSSSSPRPFPNSPEERLGLLHLCR